MNVSSTAVLRAAFAIGLAGLAGCAAIDHDESDRGEGERAEAICFPWPECNDPEDPLPAPLRPDLVPQIAAGDPCPVGNGQTMTVRVRNQGTASSKASVIKTEVTHYTGAQYYTLKRFYRINALAPGASTTVGVELGDGVNPFPGGDGATTPVGTMIFRNALPLGPGWTGNVVSWKVTVDTPFGPVWYGTPPTLLSYPAANTEVSETNNVIQGTTSVCNF
jgi:hypothetical protein